MERQPRTYSGIVHPRLRVLMGHSNLSKTKKTITHSLQQTRELPARNRISYKKIKTLLKVKDVRLAQPDEVLEHSGYPIGGVPPFNKINRILLDPTVQRNSKSIAGGGDPDKLVELETEDILKFLDPIIADFST